MFTSTKYPSLVETKDRHRRHTVVPKQFFRTFLAVLIVGTSAGCRYAPTGSEEMSQPTDRMAALNVIAESYVKLNLGLGQHDRSHVDAYYGPPEWQKAAQTDGSSVEELKVSATTLLKKLEVFDTQIPETEVANTNRGSNTQLLGIRHRYLVTQTRALVTRLEMLTGTKRSFDEESKLLYDAVAPSKTEEDFEKALTSLDHLLPGQGPLVKRFERFKTQFAIPNDLLDKVFITAINACQERTRQYINLPDNESFEIEYVRGRPWAAYNWYKGNYHSVIQINTDYPIFIDRAVDLACHEGYPGHHVYNVLLEQNLVRNKHWWEFSLYPLYSPQSLIAEGSAMFGIELAFPNDERVEFERDVLFPLAKLDPNQVKRYYEVQGLIEQLGHANIEAARRYLDGKIDFFDAIEWLETYALMPSPRPAVQFINENRSYVINYYLGRDLIKRHLEARVRNPGDSEQLWEEFIQLLSSPRVPSELD